MSKKPAAELAKVETPSTFIASSPHVRINVPFNLAHWQHLPEETASELAWFHQHALEEGLNWKQCCAALGYSQTTVWRALKGTYEGTWANVVEAIRGYRRIVSDRAAIRHADFRETEVTRLISGGLSYAMANKSITLIIGESRQGKTATSLYWRDANNHGRTVFVTAPVVGGPKALLKELAGGLGINRSTNSSVMHESILRTFNENRMLIVDEAHRCLPKDRRSDPTLLELLRDIHDRTGCGLALLATSRFSEGVKGSSYQYEQILGRIGMPVQLPREFEWEDVEPIVEQYIRQIPADLRAELLKIANAPGRLGILCETLKFASRIATKSNASLDATTIRTAIATRKKMMGETTYAKK